MCSNLHHRGQFEFVHVLKCNIGEKSGLFYEDCADFVENFEIMQSDLKSLTQSNNNTILHCIHIHTSYVPTGMHINPYSKLLNLYNLVP